MKGLNLSKFKKMHSDEHCTTLKHPDGHEIRIAHKGLKGELKKQLEKLPGYAEGGEVEGDEVHTTSRPDRGWGAIILKNKGGRVGYAEGGKVEPMPMPLPAPEAQPEHKWTAQELEEVGKVGTQITSGMPGVEAPQSETLSNVDLGMNTQQPQNGTVPAGFVPFADPTKAYQSAMGEVAGGLRAQAEAEGQLGRERADIARQQQNSLQELQQRYLKNTHELAQEGKAIIEDLKTQKIDPERFWNSKSDMGKVAGVFGLILGGIGAGLTGGENQALKFLNAQIDRDIEAQKATHQAKNNVFNALMHQMGNERDAATMMKALYTEAYSAKLEEAAGKSSDPMAKARAQQAIGQMHMQIAPQIAEMNMRRSVLGLSKEGKLAPEQAVPFLVPKEHQTEALKEVKEYQAVSTAMQNVKSAMNEVAKLQTLGERAGSPLQSKSKIDALNLQIDSLAKEMFGKVSDMEIELLKSAKVGFSDSPATVRKKTEILERSMAKGVHTPTLKAYGINLPDMMPKARPISGPKLK